jgi:CRISPR-associated endonuclease/helicase Cas3
MADTFDFETTFLHLTGDAPFPWQKALYHDWFKHGNIPPLASLPTSVEKTRVIAIWLIALALRSPLPRRLVYVVNRRTVIDRTTNETEQLRKRLASQPSRSSKSSELPPGLPAPRRSRSRLTLVQPEAILVSGTGRAMSRGMYDE